ncbi:AP endonuclease [Dokdonia sinensis]|uniref:AP endonuclease n=1 Tax=Dokdonia sinensis TaxID=2479847 RepID=A0A3M0GSE2_9FLAO|nr:TIM barrel protein [Dokdonia sinensis]RMB64149.1 AP endonuclease [Dokdonia sinensis]
MRNLLVFIILTLVLSSCGTQKTKNVSKYPFAQENLIPWSIVAFDSLKRRPAERVAMVKKLGFDRYAFGGRQEHIDKMEEEIGIARSENVEISAVWLYLNHKKDSVGKLKPMSEQVFQTLEKTGLQTQIWVGFHPEYFDGLDDDKAFTKALSMLSYLAQRAERIGCTINMYNHGGWYGDPKNQLEIINRLPQYNIGVVYNFHHAHEELDAYDENIAMLLPYLKCVNLNGMKAGGPKILTIGQGELEKQMIQRLLDLGYDGPWGILGHVKGGDPEVLLDKNMRGLWGLFPQ